MSKRLKFLSKDNIAYMIKRFYIAHQNDGGTRPLSHFQETVFTLMKGWDQLDYIDSYDSLVDDPESELDKINAEFYSEKIGDFLPGMSHRNLPRLETMDDYLNYDIKREPVDRLVNSSIYRRNNELPVNRKISRNYSRDNGGVSGRSLTVKGKAAMGMDRIWDAVNRPYRKIDENDVEYYGQPQDDSSSILVGSS